MKNEIRIGAGNRNFDRIVLMLQGVVFIVFLVLAFSYENAVVLFVLITIGIAIECFKMGRRNYITFTGSFFVVRGLFKERARISADLFESVLPSPFGRSIPFSNSLIISFKNGLQFKMMGGAARVEDINKLIKDLIG